MQKMHDALKAAIEKINAVDDLPLATLWQGGAVARIYLYRHEGFVYPSEGKLRGKFHECEITEKDKNVDCGNYI